MYNKLFSNENWRIRRRVLFALLIWLVANVQYMILLGDDRVLTQQIGIAMIGAIVTIIGTYVFGAVWDDNNKRNNISDAPPDPSD